MKPVLFLVIGVIAAIAVYLLIALAFSCWKNRYVTAVALRHIRTRSITWVAVALIAVIVLIYLLIISVLEGQKEHFMDKLQSVMAHATVSVGDYAWGIQRPEA